MNIVFKENYALQSVIILNGTVLTAKLKSSCTEARTPIPAIRIAACQFCSVSAPRSFPLKIDPVHKTPKKSPPSGRKGAQFVSNRQGKDATLAPPMPTPTGPPNGALWPNASQTRDTTPSTVALCHHDRAQVDRGQAHYPTKRTSTSSGGGGKRMSPRMAQTPDWDSARRPQD